MTRETVLATCREAELFEQSNFPAGTLYVGVKGIGQIVEWIRADHVVVNGYASFDPDNLGEIVVSNYDLAVARNTWEVVVEPAGSDIVLDVAQVTVSPQDVLVPEITTTDPGPVEEPPIVDGIEPTGETTLQTMFRCLIGVQHPNLQGKWDKASGIEGDPVELLLASVINAYRDGEPAVYSVAVDVRNILARWEDVVFNDGEVMDIASMLGASLDT